MKAGSKDRQGKNGKKGKKGKEGGQGIKRKVYGGRGKRKVESKKEETNRIKVNSGIVKIDRKSTYRGKRRREDIFIRFLLCAFIYLHYTFKSF